MFLLDALRARRTRHTIVPAPDNSIAYATPPQDEVPVTEPITTKPNDTIVVLGHGSQLVDGTSWSLQGIQSLRQLLRFLDGDITVFVCVAAQHRALVNLDNYDAWSEGSMAIGHVTLMESLNRKASFVVNPGGPCRVVICSTDYLDAITQYYECTCLTPETNCCNFAVVHLMMDQFDLTQHDAKLAIEGDTILSHHGLVVRHLNLPLQSTSAVQTL